MKKNPKRTKEEKEALIEELDRRFLSWKRKQKSAFERMRELCMALGCSHSSLQHLHMVQADGNGKIVWKIEASGSLEMEKAASRIKGMRGIGSMHAVNIEKLSSLALK